MKTLAILALILSGSAAVAQNSLPPVLTFPDSAACPDGSYCKPKQP